ncbi:MAG TPA: hypothetical protein VEZ44_15625 [bacterium]|nr:hypothetical protein [bacterium]
MWSIHPNQEWAAAILFVAALAVVLALQFWLVASGRLRMPYDLVDPDAGLWIGDDDPPWLLSNLAPPGDPRMTAGHDAPGRSELPEPVPRRRDGLSHRPADDGSSKDAA